MLRFNYEPLYGVGEYSCVKNMDIFSFEESHPNEMRATLRGMRATHLVFLISLFTRLSSCCDVCNVARDEGNNEASFPLESYITVLLHDFLSSNQLSVWTWFHIRYHHWSYLLV
ncbi:hypothetical protein LIER_34260 [Lithospermum erythrorhizon]|uniref:Uncharacterized protein n=1 Tax=Lithospermum erythrorhizon TaxID=34254 RepID=A0AAV3S2S3_LITER